MQTSKKSKIIRPVSLVIAGTAALFVVGLVVLATTTTVSVYPGNMQDWQTQTTAGAQPTPASTPSVSFVLGPATPPLNRGSAQLSVGSDGGASAQLRQPDYAGTALPNPSPSPDSFPAANELTVLKYHTYVQVGGSASQAPYIILDVDYDNNGTADDRLVFEPQYQIAGFCPSNPQGPVTTGTWQTWDAFNGCWYSTGGVAGSGPGANVKPLTAFSAAQPNAKIVNVSGSGGVRIVAGLGGVVGGGAASDWAGFVGNVDDFEIGVGFNSDTGPNVTAYDFEPGPPPAPSSQGVIISEFRNSGPGGAGDEYVELYNTANNDISVFDGEDGSGWSLVKRGNSCLDSPVVVATIPSGTIIPAHGHYLLGGVNYSLGTYPAGDGSAQAPQTTATPDQTYMGTIGGDVNIGLFNTTDSNFFDVTHRLDAVGFNNGSGGTCDLLSEGTPLPNTRASGTQYAFVRKSCDYQGGSGIFTGGSAASQDIMAPAPNICDGANGLPKNTNNNAADFVEVSTTPQTNVGDNATPILGDAGPENTSAPTSGGNLLSIGLTSPTAGQSAPPNREFNFSPDACSPLGTIKIRRKITNNSGAPITRLRFRVIDLTTTNSPNNTGQQQAILHVRTSGGETLTGVPGRGDVQINGLTDEQSFFEDMSQCGGMNTSLSDSNIVVGMPLQPGASRDYLFLLGVEQTGQYHFCVEAETLPGGGSQVFCDPNISPPTISKAFGATTAPFGSPTSMTFTLNNVNSNTQLTGVGVTDNLPSGLVVSSPNGLSNTCGGSVSATPGASTVSLSGGTIAANSSCTLTVNVTGTSLGMVANVTGPVTSTEGGQGLASNTAILQIVKADQTITFGALANKTLGNPDFAVSATASSGLPVSFAVSGNCTIAGSSVHLTGAGLCTVTASQAGNANYNAAPNVQQSFSIAQGPTTTTVSSSLNPSLLAQSVTFTATVTPPAGAPIPTGTVQFKDGTSSLGSPVTLNSSGQATLTTTSLTAGTHTITAVYSGDVNYLTSTGTLSPNQVVTNRPLISFSSSSYGVNEGDKSVQITVKRGGDTTTAFSVDFATPDDSAAMTFVPCSTAGGVASPRCDFTTALGTLNFAAGDTTKTFTVLISEDSFVEGPETFTLTLLNPTGLAGFAQPSDANATVTIIDNDFSPSSTNIIDDPQNFVRQHYHDFLNREPDAAGLSFWTNNITSCGSNQQCIAVARINVSAAFFLSIEFQNTGFYVERIYKAAFGDISAATVPVPIRFINFIKDTQTVQAGVIVGQGNWQTQLDNNKTAFALAFVQRAAFLSRYPASTEATAFVDSLNTNAGSVLSTSDRTTLINELTPDPANPALRGDVLRKIADNANFQQHEFNRAFVLMQYFGYLRRNPDAAPEATLNFDGYNFWLGKLNQFNGDFVKAEMVKAFLTSSEYRRRFGSQ